MTEQKTLKQLLFPKYDHYNDLSKKIANRTLQKMEEWLIQERLQMVKEDKIYCADVNQAFNKLLEDLKQ